RHPELSLPRRDCGSVGATLSRWDICRLHQHRHAGTRARAAPGTARAGANSPVGRTASAGGSARVGSAPGASRLFPVYAARRRVSAGTVRVLESRDTAGGRILSSAFEEDAKRAAILHGRRALVMLSAR